MSASEQHQDPTAIGNALLVQASSVRRKLLARLDMQLARADILSPGGADRVLDLVRGVHADLEPLGRQLQRFLALGPEALAAGRGVLARAGLPRLAGRLAGPQAPAAVAAAPRGSPMMKVFAAMAVGYLVGRAVR